MATSATQCAAETEEGGAELSVAMELKKLRISSLVRSLGSLFQACDRLVGIPGHG